MVKSKPVMITVAIMIAGLVVFFLLPQSDASKIKNQFYFIADKIEKIDQENPFVSAAKEDKLKEAILSPCKILSPVYDLEKDYPIKELSRFVLAKRLQYINITLRFHDFIIDIIGDTTAIVRLTGELEGQLKNGNLVSDIHEFKCNMQKADDSWKIKSIEIVEVLEK